MLRVASPYLLALGLLSAGLTPAMAAKEAPPAELLLVEVVAPATSTALGGGEWAQLTWQPGRDLGLFPLAHEWEAFLSLDGGASFPLRITPHLDLSQRSCRFEVPNFPASDVRLLIRVGNEDQELSQLVAGRWHIVADPQKASERHSFETGVAWSTRSGEKARPADRGVVAWAELGEAGQPFRQVRELPSRSWGRHATSSEVLWGLLPLLPAEPRPRALAVLATREVGATRVAVSRNPCSRDPGPSRVSPRLLESRFNE